MLMYLCKEKDHYTASGNKLTLEEVAYRAMVRDLLLYPQREIGMVL